MVFVMEYNYHSSFIRLSLIPFAIVVMHETQCHMLNPEVSIFLFSELTEYCPVFSAQEE